MTNRSESSVELVVNWFSRFTAVFLGSLLAFIVFALMVRLYIEVTLGQLLSQHQQNIVNTKKK